MMMRRIHGGLDRRYLGGVGVRQPPSSTHDDKVSKQEPQREQTQVEELPSNSRSSQRAVTRLDPSLFGQSNTSFKEGQAKTARARILEKLKDQESRGGPGAEITRGRAKTHRSSCAASRSAVGAAAPGNGAKSAGGGTAAAAQPSVGLFGLVSRWATRGKQQGKKAAHQEEQSESAAVETTTAAPAALVPMPMGQAFTTRL